MNYPTSKKSTAGGFALVVTLSLMVLLTVVAVGLLTLSTISLRSTSQGAAQAEARANARLALMLAIGDLQKSMGPDQRVSASGAIVSDSVVKHPHWTGVWNSWQAGSTDSTTDTSSEHSTIAGAANSGMSPTYQAKREDHFRSWLVSLKPEEALQVTSPANVSMVGMTLPDKNADAVQLVGAGMLGTPGKEDDFVSARLLAVKSGSSGRYGWWIGDESQKSRILSDSYQSSGTTLTSAEKLFRQQAPASTGTTTVNGLENIKDDAQLKGLPSLQSLNLVKGADGKPAQNFHSITPFSYGVLADVREGGLKRDLSTLLERPIDIRETGNNFMLYKFNTKEQWLGGSNQECVPIQDLAAYYQLYDGNQTSRAGIDHSVWKEGAKYTSNILTKGLQVVAPFYGSNKASDRTYHREYTSLYRMPKPVKVQFLLSMFAKPISPAPAPTANNPTPDTHELLIGITPSVTLWNPNNLPLSMLFNSDPNLYTQMMRMGTVPLMIRWNKNKGQFISGAKNLPWYASGVDNFKPHIFNLYFSGVRPIRFEPGEVKSFSLPFSGDVSGLKASGGYKGNWTGYNKDFFFKTDKYFEGHEVVAGWEPQSFMYFQRSAAGAAPNVVNNLLRFKAQDTISFEITADSPFGVPAFSFPFTQTNHQDYSGDALWNQQNYQFGSRTGSGAAQVAFNQNLATRGFPKNKTVISAAARSGTQLIARSKSEEGWPFMQFSLQAGVETNESANGGLAGGRRFASRPFIHSSPMVAPFLDDLTGDSLYNTGWNWSIDEINDVFEAPVQVSDKGAGYFGGGYTPETGTTHVVQQEIPVVPPMSIAALSHAYLGGFSIANDEPGGYGNQKVTAVGNSGLFPNTLQAIGNSYAHPQIPANLAYTTGSRTFDTGDGGKPIIVADHSYLANKALWDEFFFSSITPQPSTVQLFESSDRTAKKVADDFFLNNIPLPNRRMAPYKNGIDSTKLNSMFTSTQQQLFAGGLADKIAANLMLEGPFNVNSTSVDAWKILLSSLKGKPVAYLDKDKALNGVVTPDQSTPAGTPVGAFSMPNGKSVKGGSSDPKDPEQWIGSRELSDPEILELATAIVQQVKLRGPFLSLSDFINRRLDSTNKELSAKGALQAALDDSKVSINAGFRNPTREFSTTEIATMNPAFPEALKGPVAYGSSAYVDQADILRNLSDQLTPRGDTFVIRTYGDSLDPQGKVRSRAWCEAVIQRVPEYLNPIDEPHLKQSELKSVENKNFGRRLQLVSFRWLSPSEV